MVQAAKTKEQRDFSKDLERDFSDYSRNRVEEW